MPDKNGMNRRTLLRTAVGAGLLLGGVGQASATHGGDGIAIDNGSYYVEVGEQDSNDWVFDGSDDVFSEDFALSEGTVDTTWGYEATVADAFPDHGNPGTEYTAVLDFEVNNVPAQLERRVWLDSSAPLLEITYQVTNQGETSFDDLRLFQYVDYDITGDTSDNGDYIPDPEYMYQYDGSTGQAVGFTGSEPADAYSIIDPYWEPEDEIDSGQLDNHDWDEADVGDLGAALQWNFGSLAPGETTSELTVSFAAGFSQGDIEDLLTTNEVPTADFGYDPADPGPHEEITLDGSLSTDSDGSIVEYAWDLDNDGSFEEVTSTPQTTHSFSTTGEYDVTLVVTDDDGATSTPVTRTIAVGTETVEGYLEEVGPPVDCDGDGLFEDVNGDGTVDQQDRADLHQILFRHLYDEDWDLTEAQQMMFDFNGDGEFTYEDVQELGRMAERGTACSN